MSNYLKVSTPSNLRGTLLLSQKFEGTVSVDSPHRTAHASIQYFNGLVIVASGHDMRKPYIILHCDSVARFRLTSRSSAIVSLVPFPLGSETQGFEPSPITKMLVILRGTSTIHCVATSILPTVSRRFDPEHPSHAQCRSHQYAFRGVQ